MTGVTQHNRSPGALKSHGKKLASAVGGAYAKRGPPRLIPDELFTVPNIRGMILHAARKGVRQGLQIIEAERQEKIHREWLASVQEAQSERAEAAGDAVRLSGAA